MTNREAIEELKKVDTLDMPARLCEAHYMAIKALEQEPNNDAISRDAVIEGLNTINGTAELDKAFEVIERIPSVNPQEPKTGHWIYIGNTVINHSLKICECDECHKRNYGSVKYCPNCGTKMVEPQESEIHCNCTDAEIAKSFIEDVEAVKDLLPQESDHKCHTCKHYTSGERDGSCGSYICKNYSDWESEDN